MDLRIAQVFIRFCVSYAYHRCLLNLTKPTREELISLLEECLVMAHFLLDIKTIICIYNALGDLYHLVHQPEKAIHCYENFRTFISGTGELEMHIDSKLGIIYQSIGEYHKAIEHHQKILSVAISISDRKGEGEAYRNLGIAYSSLGEFHKAIEYHEKSLAIAKEIGDRQGEGGAYGNLGIAYKSLGEYPKAIEHHKKSLRIAINIGDRQGKGKAYGNLGIAYQLLGEYSKAIECHEKRLIIAKEIGDIQGEGDSNGNLGIAYSSLGKYHKAIEYHEKSLAIAKQIGDRKGEGGTYGNLGIAYESLGKYRKAIEYHERTLSIAKQIGDRQGEGATYGNLGSAYFSLGEYQKAIDYQEKRLRIAKEISDKLGEATAYGNLGIVYGSLGEYHKAIEYHEKRLSIAKQIGDRQGEEATYGNLGSAYDSLGEYHKAIEYHEKTLSTAKQIIDRQGEGATYGNLGNAYYRLGEIYKAIEYHEKSLAIAEEIGDKQGEGLGYGNLGIAYQSLGEIHKAIEYHEKSLSIAKEIGDKQGEGVAYGNLGIAYKSLGEYQKTIDYHEKSLSIAKEIGDKQGEGVTYGNLGIAYCSLGEYHKAIECHEKRLSIAKEIGDRQGQAAYHHNIGIAYQEESSITDLSKSKEHLEKSLQCYEKLFDDLKDKDQFKVSIVDTFITTYKMLSEVYIKTGQVEGALMVCERGRARALRDLLFLKYNTNEKAESKALELADVKTISSYREGCILFYNLHGNKVTYDCWIISSQSPSIFYYDEMENIEALATMLSSLSEDDKTNMKMGYFQCLVDNSFRQLRQGMKCDDQSINLLDHENGESAASTRSSKLKETALTVFRQVDRWCASTDDEDNIEPLDVLSRRLLSPVINQLTHEEVIIIPDGPLFMVPFAALQDPVTGKYLSETKRIRLAPSMTALKILQESSDENCAKSGALIIGNPTGDLPGAEEEAVEIGNLLGVQPLIGKQATKEAILKKLKLGVSVIHFAAHGSKKNGQILLAPSISLTNSCPAEEYSILTMKEAQESGIRAELVVLSCCHTGKGDIRSEGVVGIARAFLAAGARAVVASLWAIDDTATKFFMLKFYSHLKNGESASKGLQQAMKEMREIERYKEPKYWAAFFLIGDDVIITG